MLVCWFGCFVGLCWVCFTGLCRCCFDLSVRCGVLWLFVVSLLFLLVGWGELGLLVRCFVVLGFCNLVAIPLIVLVGCIRLVFMCC